MTTEVFIVVQANAYPRATIGVFSTLDAAIDFARHNIEGRSFEHQALREIIAWTVDGTGGPLSCRGVAHLTLDKDNKAVVWMEPQS